MLAYLGEVKYLSVRSTMDPSKPDFYVCLCFFLWLRAVRTGCIRRLLNCFGLLNTHIKSSGIFLVEKLCKSSIIDCEYFYSHKI